MRAAATHKTPGGVRAIAWLYIVSGVLSVLMVTGGVLLNSALTDLPDLSSLSGMNADISPQLTQMASSRSQFGWPDIYELVFAATALWCGIGLLQRKPWSRGATLWLSWLTLATTVAFGVYYIYLWRDISATLSANIGAPADQQHMLQTVGSVSGIVLTAVFCAPWVAAIIYLRGAAARAALAPANTTASAGN